LTAIAIRPLLRRGLPYLLALVLGWATLGCAESDARAPASKPEAGAPPPAESEPAIAEVAPPATIRELRRQLAARQPQVTITAPEPGRTLQEPRLALRVRVQDWPLFADPEWGLGPHLHVALDGRPYRTVYDTSDPIVFADLAGGSHTVRAFAAYPWHESAKNEGAYAQTRFHVFTETGERMPDPDRPQLTYNLPQGQYGAEPILLDWHLSGLEPSAAGNPSEWQLQVTLNGERFRLQRWMPVYLSGLRPGQNWIRLQLLDGAGEPVANAFNDTVRGFAYQPGGQDALSRLKRGDLSPAQARRLIDPHARPPSEPEQATGSPQSGAEDAQQPPAERTQPEPSEAEEASPLPAASSEAAKEQANGENQPQKAPAPEDTEATGSAPEGEPS